MTSFQTAWDAVQKVETRLRENGLDNNVPYLFAQVEIAMRQAKKDGPFQNDLIVAAAAAVEKKFFPKK